MPAVSVCDPLAVALRHNLDAAGQSKSSDDLNISLAGSASRILRTEIDYEETDNYRSTVQERLKSKYMVLSLPKQDNTENGKVKEGAAACSKTLDKDKEPRLPEPNVVLYPPDKVNLGWNKNFPIGTGMYNVGNTCYLNSTLQALFHVPALVNWLLSDSHHKSKCEQNVRHCFFLDGGCECLTCAVAKTLQYSHEKTVVAIKPFLVYNKLKLICRTMVPGQQEDAHEFLRYLLEGMEKAYLARYKATKLDSYSKETTPINQIFGGYIRTEVKCLQCRHVSTTFQHFQDLLLDIRKAGTLDEALAGYFSQEQLDNNDYKCEACKRRVPATKQFILERPPKVLCVQLKRFSVLGGKISRHIGFKQTIDMSPYIRRKPGEPPSKLTYKLASMVTHMGPSVNCGHYTAIAQVSSGQFYSFDDSCVLPIVFSNVVSTNAYIMIFEMEPSSSLNCQSHNNQVMSTKNDSSISKNPQSFSNSNGFSSKLLDGNSGSKLTPPSKSDENGSSSKPKDQENNSVAPSPPPPPPPPPLTSSTNKRRNFIGPQLPPHMEKNRLYELSKNSKLVDYDGDSSDDDGKNGSSSSKSLRDERQIVKSTNNSLSPGSSSNKTIKANGNGYSHSPEISRPPSTQNGNGHHSLSNGVDASNGVGSSSSGCSSRGSSPRESSPKNGHSVNGKAEHNNGGSPSTDDKWYNPKGRSDPPEQKVYTKASVNRGWQVCKDSSSPSSAAPVNGWDEINSNGNRFNNQAASPNAAEMRSFNGTNRSDTVAQLQKLSHWGYGNSSNVHSWNGGKARLEREVDNQRHQDRKRLYEDEEDELDRGRLKKVKHHDYKNHDARYNRFQEHQNNGLKWKYNNNNHYRLNHNNHSYRRHGNGGNYNRQHHRYHNNKSRNGWHR
ncbi:ubiquitin carboxyl-terminal hydrolase 36 isoform X3 [Phymastichus coffea]|uniref:ubiquitin carboxyl-terminal hydrolase 36 isoform X3 n=1 Tax=Phymastichus coffea TaxID=108790 RepID=UPI00273B29BD|nr:ubiquitin carboxyl-terminal hydrolase 36 isoform X3 [Phymastichus coffea]